MEQTDLANISESTKFDSISKEELIRKYTLLETELAFAIKEIYRLKNQNLTDSQLGLILAEQLGELQQKLYGSSSERYKSRKKKRRNPIRQNLELNDLAKDIPIFP